MSGYPLLFPLCKQEQYTRTQNLQPGLRSQQELKLGTGLDATAWTQKQNSIQNKLRCFLSLWLKQQKAFQIRSRRINVAPVYALSSILAKEGKREEVQQPSNFSAYLLPLLGRSCAAGRFGPVILADHTSAAAQNVTCTLTPSRTWE